MKNLRKGLLASAAVLAPMMASAQLLNGQFLPGTAPGDPNPNSAPPYYIQMFLGYTGIPDWTVEGIGGGSAWVGTTYGNPALLQGTDPDSIEFNVVDTASQTFTTLGSTNYRISFWTESDIQSGSNVSMSMLATFTNNGVNQSFEVLPQVLDSYTQFSFTASTAPGTTTSTLTFQGGSGVPFLDNISVAAVPEPMPFACLGLGVLGLALRKRPKR